VWLCKLNERGMLRRSSCRRRHCGTCRSADPHPVPLAQTRPGTRAGVEKILETPLLKISV